MHSSSTSLSRFYRTLFQTAGLFIVFAITFLLYVQAEKSLNRAHELRLQSHLLTDELRQSSDDLTRMVRTYVLTSDPIYKRHYEEILDIRNGKKPRPLHYENVYWDMVLSDDKRPRPYSTHSIALLDLMKHAGYTPDEFSKLSEAKAHSDKLTRTGHAAMKLIETVPLTEENRRKAYNILHDAAYHHSKARIMKLIGEVDDMVDRRTLDAIHTQEYLTTAVRLLFIAFGTLLMFMLWRVYHTLRSTLGGSLNELYSHISRIGRGDFTSHIPVAKGMENSIMGWISETQIKLARIDTERKDAEEANLQTARVYALLNHCNEAIIRSGNETELFSNICYEAVTNGKIKMAWIGLIDNDTKRLKPAAYAGEGTEYLENIVISIDANDPSGHGPSGTVCREDKPFWCQDFQHNPFTAPWHDRGVQYGWKSSAALPLHKNGRIIGTINLYVDQINAFDEATRNLLIQMAVDIDHALTNFAHDEARKKTEEYLRANQQHLKAIVETEPECVKLLDPSGKLVEMNPAGLNMLEVGSLEEAQQRPLVSYLLPQWREPFIALQQKVMRGESDTLEFEILGEKGTRRWLETHAVPMRNNDGDVTTVLAITRDITERKNSEERIIHMINYDTLTGLPNRTKLDDHFQYTLNLSQRSRHHFSVLFLDLDHFKEINDSLGHTIGDKLLIELAGRLEGAMREEDTVSRLGGDEFIILLPDTDAEGAARVAQKLLEMISAPFSIEQHELNVRGSIGIALYPADGTDRETLSKNADAAMYRAKQLGRNTYSFFTEEIQAKSIRNLRLSNALHQALGRNEFHLVYQPQIAIKTGHVIGAEALLRWEHPELGLISPAEFIPVAENSGLILPIGEWVLRTAVKQLREWLDRGMAPILMAVNLSAIQFRHLNLPQLITQILEESGLPPEYLELELTEGIAMHDPQGAISIMNNLHERGVRMSIDDFGTGYSSLSYLKQFKVYKLKIDQSFVRDITIDPEDKAIVGAIINMARSLGLQTIAEGVETAEQLNYLQDQGCDEIQGYYYSKPVRCEEFEHLCHQAARLGADAWIAAI